MTAEEKLALIEQVAAENPQVAAFRLLEKVEGLAEAQAPRVFTVDEAFVEASGTVGLGGESSYQGGIAAVDGEVYLFDQDKGDDLNWGNKVDTVRIRVPQLMAILELAEMHAEKQRKVTR